MTPEGHLSRPQHEQPSLEDRPNLLIIAKSIAFRDLGGIIRGPMILKRSYSFTFVLFLAFRGLAQTNGPIKILLDITDAPRKILHAKLSIPVQPGPFTLVYPRWIPGEHGPTGPVDNLAGITFSASGESIPWQRDDVNMFAFHLAIPSGVHTVEAKADFLATAAPSGFSAGASTSANLCVVSWNEVVLYPAAIPAAQVTFEPSIKLPDGWKLATALTTSSIEGSITHFRPVSLQMLIDSPALTGLFFKEVPLAAE